MTEHDARARDAPASPTGAHETEALELDRRTRELREAAAHAEPLYWSDDRTHAVDRWKRTEATVRAELAEAVDLAGVLESLIDRIETRLTPGRTFGPQLSRRLWNSVETLVNVIERDRRIVDAFEVQRDRD